MSGIHIETVWDSIIDIGGVRMFVRVMNLPSDKQCAFLICSALRLGDSIEPLSPSLACVLQKITNK